MNQDPTVKELSQRVDVLEKALGTCEEEKKALEISVERYRAIVKNTSEAVVVIQNEKVKLANSVAVSMSGFSFNGKPGASRSFLEWIHPDDRETVIRHYGRRLEGKNRPFALHFGIPVSNKGYQLEGDSHVGESVWVSGRLFRPHPGGRGEPVGGGCWGVYRGKTFHSGPEHGGARSPGIVGCGRVGAVNSDD